LASLGHPCKFQRLSRLGSVTARHSSSGRQPNFAALNRGRHLHLAKRLSRWALAHILVKSCNVGCCLFSDTLMSFIIAGSQRLQYCNSVVISSANCSHHCLHVIILDIAGAVRDGKINLNRLKSNVRIKWMIFDSARLVVTDYRQLAYRLSSASYSVLHFRSFARISPGYYEQIN